MDPADRDFDELERLLDREVRALPSPPAPPTLMPRVMAAVAARPLVARRRGWFGWPTGWRVASVAALALVVAGFVLATPVALAMLAGAWDGVGSGASQRVTDVIRRVDLTAAAVRVLCRVLFQPVVAYVFALVAAMSVAYAVLTAALGRIAQGGPTTS